VAGLTCAWRAKSLIPHEKEFHPERDWTPPRLLILVRVKRILRFVSGVGLLLIGLAGLLLPILPGWVFIIPGLIILADFYPPIHRLVEWGKTKAAAAGIIRGPGAPTREGGSQSPPPPG
jgi:hypothetical protein